MTLAEFHENKQYTKQPQKLYKKFLGELTSSDINFNFIDFEDRLLKALESGSISNSEWEKLDAKMIQKMRTLG
jgi:hypothetical protein